MKKLKIFALMALAALLVAPAMADEIDDFFALLDLADEASGNGEWERARSIQLSAMAIAQAETDSAVRGKMEHKVRVPLRESCLKLGLTDEALEHCMWFHNYYRAIGDTELLPFAYMSTARLYAQLGDERHCYEHLDSCCALAEEYANPYLGALVNTSGLIHKDFGDYAGAEPLMVKSVNLARQGDDAEELYYALFMLADNYARQSKLVESRDLYREVAKLTRDSMGELSPEHLKARLGLAELEASTGDTIAGCNHYSEVLKAYRDNLREQLRVLPASSREARLAYMLEVMRYMTPYAIRAQRTDDDFSLNAYNGLLASKGMLLASERSTASIIASYGSDEDKDTYQRLMALREELTELESQRGADPEVVADYYRRIMDADRRLASGCARYGDVSAFLETDFSTIADALRPGEAVVDFTNYVRRADGEHYAVYIIKHGWSHPRLVHLCAAAPIDSLLALEGGRIRRLHTGESADCLSEMIVKPLLQLTEASTIYYVPSGIFHSIALEALPAGDGKLVGDVVKAVRLSSAREVAVRGDAGVDVRSAVLYGGLDYDLTADTGSAADSLRGAGTDALSSLAYTRMEIDTIASILGDCSRVRCLTGNLGTEESFTAMSGNSPSVIHVATHGFYFKPGDTDRAEGLKGYTDAMNLSGLVMAGGNAGWLGQQAGDGKKNGLLTAGDIARLDLGGTELVCLASCDTGRGEITAEGVYGLQRAFKKAGAQTLVLSLWEASDTSTSMFMTRFYQLMGSGMGRHDAFAAARMEVRKAYPDPFYWAGFVMVD